MEDIYNATIICNECNTETEKVTLNRDGFAIRAWKCPSCGREWLHPGDLAMYQKFKELKQKNFEVKLRLVGNSWAVSIPKDIIQFEEVHTTKTVRMSLDEPGKISITFTKFKRINDLRR